MNSNEIKPLLEKYIDGKTTLQEEHLLRSFLCQEDLPDDLKQQKILFDFFDEEAKESVSPRFIAEPWLVESTGKVVPFFSNRKRWIFALTLAASIVFVMTFTLLFRLGIFSPKQPFGTISDPELAYIETRQALELFSEKFNGGLSHAKNLNAFSKGINKAEKLKQFNQYRPIIINQDHE